MKYINRTIEEKFIRMSAFFKAVLVTGARQVGKTTLLRHLSEGQPRTYVTLDNLMARKLAQTDPVLFFQTYKPPIIIDEIQYAPELLVQIKIMCDESEETGRFWLTGSQQYSVMKNVRETLAGRLGLMQLFSLTKNEKEGIFFSDELDFSLSCLQQRYAKVQKKNDLPDVFDHIWHGGMPQVLFADAEQRQMYFDSYIDTYLMRDVAELGGITDSIRFRTFLTACAALASQQLNYKTLADASGISQPTAKQWVGLLEGLCIIYLLKPYYNNTLKRLSKTPKLYFFDTGLCAYLTMWLTKETLMTGAASGHFFENHVIIELLKHYSYAKAKVNLSYYRDSNAIEIDVLIEENNQIHPIEIKKSANPDGRDVKRFHAIDKAQLRRGCGGIVCMCEEVIPIDNQNCFIPCNLI